MAVLEGGISGAIAGVAAESAEGLHIIAKPQDAGTLGHYAASVQTGTIAAGAGANSEIFQFRWTDSTRLCVITEIACDGMLAFTAFAAGSILLSTSICRVWTVDGSGGNLVTLTADNQNLRASFGGSLAASSVRTASTGALTAGTKTIDSQPVGQILSHSSGGVGSATPIIGSIYLPKLNLFKADIGSGEHPIVLVQNEGVVIRATVPATGTWTAGFTIKWMELSAF